ncbi:hypothetical protein QTQ03_16455 [Micromonospora sp. WMMA1363]|uniref:hypothetical protein n=1 Tax=Micromonospora sp. WMMA1363 TaxID=3053985 RepID=UPI00259C7765|nr:hypothetical protein [Micromonospora sp. WMMA1363]MDM4721111.1 hypothetical protein [Micromonospora sp. WMMA1363]
MNSTLPVSKSILVAAVALSVAAALTIIPGPPGSADPGFQAVGHVSHSEFEMEILAKAKPDECFAGIGEPYPPGPPCADGVPKVNQAYVWSMVRSDRSIWLGTTANLQCLVLSKLKSTKPAEPMRTEDYACEYGESEYMKQRLVPPLGERDPRLAAGDARPPQVVHYDIESGRTTEKTGDIINASITDALRLKSTLGIRAAGAHDGVVLLAGLGIFGGINLFAFDSVSGDYLGSTTFLRYSNIRNFVVADGALYAGVGVGRAPGSVVAIKGAVLRWTGSKSDPFQFDLVGHLPAEAADLTAHNGRIFAITWAGDTSLFGPGAAAPGVWRSPALVDGAPGLTEDDAYAWRQVWSVTDYEPDPTIARTYGLGGLTAYGGRLYWGTMHVPGAAVLFHSRRHPSADTEERRTALTATHRATALFRSAFDDEESPVELLYGESNLPAFDPDANDGAGAWRPVPTGYRPRFGRSGFGNTFNNYTWDMVVADGRLFVGTMDWSYLSRELRPNDPSTDAALDGVDPAVYGADLWVFDSAGAPARPVDTVGLGNYLNYGFRTMVADGPDIYIGTANPMNLRTNPDDNVPEGGWELIRLTATSRAPE